MIKEIKLNKILKKYVKLTVIEAITLCTDIQNYSNIYIYINILDTMYVYIWCGKTTRCNPMTELSDKSKLCTLHYSHISP